MDACGLCGCGRAGVGPHRPSATSPKWKSVHLEEESVERRVIFMDEKKKQWCCKNGHILGFIRWNGQGVPQLMVLRVADVLSRAT